MIVPLGVLVEPELAPIVLAMVAEAVKRDHSRDSQRLKRLRVDLADLAEFSSEFGRALDELGGPWLTSRQVVAATGKSDRTVRRWAAAVAKGRSARFRAAQMEGGTWRIKL